MKLFTMIACAASLMLAACGTITPNGAPSLNDEGVSPRWTTVGAADTVIDVMDGLTDAATLGLLPANFADDIVQFAPDVEKVAVAYLDATASCVVIDGSLQTDPATGGVCSKSVLLRTFGDVSTLLRQAAIKAGVNTDAGRVLGVASIVLRRQLQPSPGDVWTGYAKTPDVPLEQFNAMRDDLRAARDRLIEAAAANAAAKKK